MTTAEINTRANVKHTAQKIKAKMETIIELIDIGKHPLELSKVIYSIHKENRNYIEILENYINQME